MSSTRNPGRVAGLLYLLLVLAGPVRLIYIPSKLFVHGNATATADNIAAHELLFRLGIVSDLFCGTILIFLLLALYRLFKGVDQNLAVLMVILGGVMPALIDFVGVVSDAAALMVVGGADFLSVFEKPQRDALAMMFLRLRDHQNTAAEILWGLWLFPLAILSVQVTLASPLPGRLARHQWLRLCDPQPYGRTVTAVRRQVVYHLPARPLCGSGVHAMARDQGRQAACAGRRSRIVGGWLGHYYEKSSTLRPLGLNRRCCVGWCADCAVWLLRLLACS